MRKQKEEKVLTVEELAAQKAREELLAKTEQFIAKGRKGVTNAQMIKAINDNIGDEETLRLLFEAFDKVFVSSAKYVANPNKLVLEKLIQEKYPEHKANMSEKSRVKLTAPVETPVTSTEPTEGTETQEQQAV